ncbi:hypothetical protein KCP69_14230 [Salmonella enterica subsp. enterica]|nr:hypothetical protein KCP69_14230 [Salmonella enterica subsp. enterica]
MCWQSGYESCGIVVPPPGLVVRPGTASPFCSHLCKTVLTIGGGRHRTSHTAPERRFFSAVR